MITFTKDAYRELNQYEQHFIRATKANYIMGVTPKLAEEFLRWYKALGGNKHINLGCSNCVYTMVKELGKAYFDFVKMAKEHHPSWIGLAPEEEEDVEEIVTEEPKEVDITEEEMEKMADELNAALAKEINDKTGLGINPSGLPNGAFAEELPKTEEKVSQKAKKGGAVKSKGKKGKQ